MHSNQEKNDLLGYIHLPSQHYAHTHTHTHTTHYGALFDPVSWVSLASHINRQKWWSLILRSPPTHSIMTHRPVVDPLFSLYLLPHILPQEWIQSTSSILIQHVRASWLHSNTQPYLFNLYNLQICEYAHKTSI